MLYLALYLLFSWIIGNLPYPRSQGKLAALLRELARLSALRFRDSPATVHFPGFAQPEPDPKEPPEGALMAMGGEGERAFRAAGGLLGVQDVAAARRAWAAASRSIWAEWQRLLALRAIWSGWEPSADPPRPPTVIMDEPDTLQTRYENGPAPERREPSKPPPVPRGGGVALILAVLLGLACSGAPRRAATALEVWGQALDAQIAAVAELSELTRVTEEDLVRPRPGRTRGEARADLGRWWDAQEAVLETARLARKATQGASVELALDSGPEAKEAAARAAWEAARRLQRELEQLHVLSAELRRQAAKPRVLDGGADAAGVR